MNDLKEYIRFILIENIIKCGRCYELAFKFVKDNNDNSNIKLAHGQLKTSVRHIKNHAWIESLLPTGQINIYDPSANIFSLKEDLKKKNINYIKEAEYSAEEMMINALKVKHFGPWHK